eukprot:jgi/Ulvmu1/11824/UM080_0035.1
MAGTCHALCPCKCMCSICTDPRWPVVCASSQALRVLCMSTYNWEPHMNATRLGSMRRLLAAGGREGCTCMPSLPAAAPTRSLKCRYSETPKCPGAPCYAVLCRAMPCYAVEGWRVLGYTAVFF